MREEAQAASYIISARSNRPRQFDIFAASPGRLPGRVLRWRYLSAARPPALRVHCRAVRATRQPWRVHVNRDGHGRIPHASSPRLRQPAARSASACSGSATHGMRPRPNAGGYWRHVSRASRPSSGAHPAHGRPVCCRVRAVRTQPVSRPVRAAYTLAHQRVRMRHGAEGNPHARHPRGARIGFADSLRAPLRSP